MEVDAMEVLVGLAAFVIAGAAGYAAGRVRVPPRDDSPAAQDWVRAEQGQPWQAAASVPDKNEQDAGADSRPERERARLIGACADLADRLRDRQPALYAALTRELAAVGVTVRIPDGEPFDAAFHNAVGAEPATDPGQHLRVAETTRLGYLDHGVQVRVPDVIVYRWQEA